MINWYRTKGFFVMLWAASLHFMTGPVAAAEGTACGPLDYAGNRYTICEIDTAKAKLDLFWRDEQGEALGSFRRLNRYLEGQGKELSIAMNGGMYHRDLSPVGLFVKDGKRLKAANTRSGWGNFHLKPNGVFFLDEKGRPGVLETSAFLKRNPAVKFATQSGPMLVIDGKLHPRFLVDATSHKLRNGVGVKSDGTTVIFAITENPVTFHQFGTLFKDHLKITNALFLDGSISSLYARQLNRADGLHPMGPILGVFE